MGLQHRNDAGDGCPGAEMDRHAEFGQPLDSQIPLDPQAPDIDALEIIADWQLDLRKRIKRAELVLVDLRLRTSRSPCRPAS
jgi:hypothetical protein